MECEHCGYAQLVKGRLEGLSFVPEKEEKKFLATGVYGIVAMVCPKCGRMRDFMIDTATLGKILKKK